MRLRHFFSTVTTSIVCGLLGLFATVSSAQTPADNPTGAAGEFWPAIRSGCNIDSFTGSTRRKVVDLVVANSVGVYPLAFGRTSTSAYDDSRTYEGNSDHTGALNVPTFLGDPGSWRHSYQWSIDESGIYNGMPSGYTVNYPNGNRVTFAKKTTDAGSEDPYLRAVSPTNGFLTGVRDRVIPISPSNPSVAKLVLPDGGQVQFADTPVTWSDGTHHFTWKLKAIVDPYGQTTNITYSSDGLIETITEPVGRWIKIYFRAPLSNERFVSDKIIDHVTASDGRTVQYSYSIVPGQLSGLTTVNYYGDSALVAQYTYGLHPPSGRPLLDTADDPMYAGPMRRIQYEYEPIGPYTNPGTIRAERNLTTGEMVTSFYGRTEIRSDGKRRSFSYGGPYTFLLTWSDFENHWMSRTYDDHGFINSFTDAKAKITSWTNDPLTGNALDVTYPAAPGTAPGLPQGTIHYKYGWAACPDTNNRDANNPYYLYSDTDEGNHTTIFTRDANKRIARIDYPDGGYETFSYNAFGQVLTHRLTTGGTESFTYDSRGLKTEYRDSFHNPITKTGNPTIWYQYDSLDRLSGETDSQGASPGDPAHTTNYAYNSRNEIVTVTRPTDPIDNVRHQILFGYNMADGTRISATDELSHTTTFTYDEYKRLRSITTPQRESGDNMPRTAQIFYDASGTGDDLTHTDSNVTYAKSPGGKTVAILYNGNYWKLSATVGQGSEAATTSYDYDENGNPVSVLSPNEQPNQPFSGKSVTAGYDERNRPAWIKDALKFPTWFTYDAAGRRATVNRPNGQTISYDSYDAMNRVLQQTATQTPDPDAVTKFTYYPSGLLNTMKDPHLVALNSSYSYTYSYDDMGRKVSLQYPPDSSNIQRTESWHYDSFNRLDTYTNRAGNIQTFTYDSLYRLKGFAWNDNGITPSATFGYDVAGRPMSIVNANAQIDRVYFDDNLLKSETTTYGDHIPRIVSYTYDADSNRASILYPDGQTPAGPLPNAAGNSFAYHYTSRNQLKELIDNSSGNPIASYLYDLDGNPASRTLDNGTSSSFAYDVMDRLTNISHALNGTTRTFEYAYDSVSNRKWVRRDGTDGDVFGYDLNSQSTSILLNVSNPTTAATGTQTINYDANGNRVAFSPYGHTDTYATNNLNQYTARNGTPASYDANGNMIGGLDGSSYVYDAQNRMITATKGATVEKFAYDGLNRQISRTFVGAPIATLPSPTPVASPTPASTPVPTATPTPDPTPPPTEECKDVSFSETYDTPTRTLYVSMATDTAGATIFYTVGTTNTIPAPTHTGGTAGSGTYIYSSPIAVAYNTAKHFKALAYHAGMVDSRVTYHMGDNVDFDPGGGGGGGGMQPASAPSPTPGSLGGLPSSPVPQVFYNVYDGWNLIAEYSSGVLVAATKYLPGIKNLTTNQYYYRDDLGSTSHLADNQGHLLEWYRYDLQGTPMFFNAANESLPASAYGNRFLFTGQQWYAELGLYDLRNRFYSPDMGRFIQADPIGFGGDATNLYRYVGNNVINGVDPMGLDIIPHYNEDGDSGGSTTTPSGPEVWIDPLANDTIAPDPVDTYRSGSASRSTGGSTSGGSTTGGSVSVGGGTGNSGVGVGGGGPGPGPGGLGANSPGGGNPNMSGISSISGSNVSTNGVPIGSGGSRGPEKASAVAGAVQSMADLTVSGASIGSNFKFYRSGWQGNQYVTSLRLAGPLKATGGLLFGAGVVYDGTRVLSGDLSLEHAGVNTVFGAAAFAGPPGAAISVTYFGIEAFYPGGFVGDGKNPGWFADYGAMMNETGAAPFSGPP